MKPAVSALSGWRATWIVARCELRRLLRDQKAILFAVALPVLAYPLLFWGSRQLGEVGERQMAERRVTVAADLTALPDDLAARVAELLARRAPALSIESAELAAEAEVLFAAEPAAQGARRAQAGEALGAWARSQLAADRAALLLARPPPGAAADGGPARLVFLFEGSSEDGIAAAGHILPGIESLGEVLLSERLVAELGADPAVDLAFEPVDLVRREDAAGLALGRFLPLIAVLVLLSGGAFAALDAFAGEREQGTLETLLSQPVPTWALAWGKFFVVLATSLAAWCGNAASLALTSELGLLALPGGDGLPVEAAGVELGRILLASAVFLPTVVLLAAVLSLLSARARSFREGQHYLLPLTLLAAAGTAPALAPDVRLDTLVALVPLAGPSLALRDALTGSLATGPALVAVAASLLYAVLALSRLATTLDGERLFAGASLAEGTGGPDASRDQALARRALTFGLVVVLAVYVLGGWLQSLSLVPGLLATLWGLVLGSALLLAYLQNKARGTGLLAELGLAAADRKGTRQWALPFAPAAAAALLAGPGLAQLGRRFFELQERVLPLPAGMDAGALGERIAAMDATTLVLLFAVSPGVTEELFFRGALLTGLLAAGTRTRAVLWQALLFALVHASLYRFGVTFLLGLLFGALALRRGGLLLAVLAHTAYNASQLLTEREATTWLAHPLWLALLVPCALTICLPRRRTPAA